MTKNVSIKLCCFTPDFLKCTRNDEEKYITLYNVSYTLYVIYVLCHYI